MANSDCIEWAGAKNSNGYGNRTIGGKNYATHRLAWSEANGPIPEGMCVLHHCDNPPCMNVDHLFLGTIADNTADMMAKGRGTGPPAQHGGTHMYRHYGCRCVACKKAWSEYQHERYLVRKASVG